MLEGWAGHDEVDKILNAMIGFYKLYGEVIDGFFIDQFQPTPESEGKELGGEGAGELFLSFFEEVVFQAINAGDLSSARERGVCIDREFEVIFFIPSVFADDLRSP